jgi:hypothetical protein
VAAHDAHPEETIHVEGAFRYTEIPAIQLNVNAAFTAVGAGRKVELGAEFSWFHDSVHIRKRTLVAQQRNPRARRRAAFERGSIKSLKVDPVSFEGCQNV